jgi:hypothetical protein
MISQFLKKYYSQVILLMVIVALIIIKFPHLSFPYCHPGLIPNTLTATRCFFISWFRLG